MKLGFVDILIVIAYMVILIVIAKVLKKRASASMDDYFLGGRKMPWWALGVTGMAAWLDITGTMIITSFLFMLGPRGLFVEFRGGAGLVLIFCMLWLGKWHRRSGCMTGAEWMNFRFGTDKGAHLARIISAGAVLIFCVGILAYSFVGAGLFLATFLPFKPWICTLLLVTITTIYTVDAGFYGVVVTDIFQMSLVVFGVISVIIIALMKMHGCETSLEQLAIEVTGNKQWMSSVPNFQTTMPKGYEQYNGLFAVTMFYLVKTMIQGLGMGNEPKYFGARNDRECGLLSFLMGWLMSIRWALMIGFVILGLFLVKDWFPNQQTIEDSAIIIKSYFSDVSESGWPSLISSITNESSKVPAELIENLKMSLGSDWANKINLVNFNGTVNTERILPSVLLSYVPTGVRGLILVALLAAAMSTFNAFINMATGYFTRDIYQGYMRPQAKNRELMLASYAFGIFLVGAGLAMAYTSKSINDIWGWLSMSLAGGMVVPMALRMYWWRFNGFGFAIGTIAGMCASLVQRFMWPELTEGNQFLFSISIGLIASVVVTLATKSTDRAVLENYYSRVRPFGFWGDLDKCLGADELKAKKSENFFDLLSLPFALFWQITVLLLPLQIMIGAFKPALITSVILCVSLIGLYYFWYKKLPAANE